MSPADTGLSIRERQALMFAAHGLERKEIPAAMGIAYDTVKNHLRNAFRKLEALNAADAVRRGFIRGELSPCTEHCVGCRYLAERRQALCPTTT